MVDAPEVADTALYLCSHLARGVTGEISMWTPATTSSAFKPTQKNKSQKLKI